MNSPQFNNKQSVARQQTQNEEVFNSITHGIGAMMSIAAMVILIVFAVLKGDGWRIASVLVYGISLVLLYLSSTLYHGITNPKVKNLFARFDHVSIFLLIAGTYTPFLILTLRGVLGWILFGFIWGIAVVGVVIRLIYLTRFSKVMVAVYLGMGWLFIVVIGPLARSLPVIILVLIFTGGISYSLGVIFFTRKRLKFGHGIWHLFVLAGSILHFFAVFFTLFGA